MKKTMMKVLFQFSLDLMINANVLRFVVDENLKLTLIFEMY